MNVNAAVGVYFAVFVVFLEAVGSPGVWKGGDIPFRMTEEMFTPREIDSILNVLEQIRSETCINFRNLDDPASSGLGTQLPFLTITRKPMKHHCDLLVDDNSFNATFTAILGEECLSDKRIARLMLRVITAQMERGDSEKEEYILDGETKTPPDETEVNDRARSLRDLTSFQPEEGSFQDNSIFSPAEEAFMRSLHSEECRGGARRNSRATVAPHKSPPTEGLLREKRESKAENSRAYYRDKVWPYGVIFYGIDGNKTGYADLDLALRFNMQVISSRSCVLWRDVTDLPDRDSVKNVIWFRYYPAEEFPFGLPAFGFSAGHQVADLERSLLGWSDSWIAHPMMMLFRVMGVPQESNRHDRDSHISIDWNHVIKELVPFFDEDPPEAELGFPYDYGSVTHSPFDAHCGLACEFGPKTVTARQDVNWENTMRMGHDETPSATDFAKLQLVYGEECARRGSFKWN